MNYSEVRLLCLIFICDVRNMPYGKRYGRKKRANKKRGGARRKKKYSISISKLKSKAVDSLLERRIQELSKVEIARDVLKLTLRRQINAYNSVTNQFTIPAAKLTFDGWGPLVVESNLRLAVAQSLATGTQPVFASDPLTVDNEVVYPMIYPADTALPVIPKMGCRTGDTIKIDSISVKLRVRMKESTQNAYSNKIEATFALFRVHKNYVVSNAIPAVRELFAAGRYRPWNYILGIQESPIPIFFLYQKLTYTIMF